MKHAINLRRYGERDAWLQRAAARFMVEWAKHGVVVPLDVKVSCGVPSEGAPSRRLGECWPRAASKTGVNEIFISPALDRPLVVLEVLGHELVHAADDCKSMHGHAFTALSKCVGYSGGKHSAAATDDAKRFLAVLAGELGPYPATSGLARSKGYIKKAAAPA